MIDALVLSCEHGGNRIPAPYRPLFASPDARAALDSHRGFDLGALALARALARSFDAPLLGAATSRLLVDLNRSPGHPKLLSCFTAHLDAAEREALLDAHYHPHRARVRDALEHHLARRRRVLHLAVHSFTPVLDGRVRDMDLGLLYDPARAVEHRFCALWKSAIAAEDPGLRVRRNAPYRGAADGLTTALRRLFAAHRYLGVELEVNQALAAGARAFPRRITALIVAGLRRALDGLREQDRRG